MRLPAVLASVLPDASCLIRAASRFVGARSRGALFVRLTTGKDVSRTRKDV